MASTRATTRSTRRWPLAAVAALPALALALLPSCGPPGGPVERGDSAALVPSSLTVQALVVDERSPLEFRWQSGASVPVEFHVESCRRPRQPDGTFYPPGSAAADPSVPRDTCTSYVAIECDARGDCFPGRDSLVSRFTARRESAPSEARTVHELHAPPGTIWLGDYLRVRAERGAAAGAWLRSDGLPVIEDDVM